MCKCKAEENWRRNYKENCTSYVTEMKELEPSIQVFRTHASRRGQCLLSKLETSCQASSMKLRTAVAIAKLKASSPLFLFEKDETERLIMMANQYYANWEVPVIRGTNAHSWDVSVCHAKRLFEKPSLSKIFHEVKAKTSMLLLVFLTFFPSHWIKSDLCTYTQVLKESLQVHEVAKYMHYYSEFSES